ncbi:MAG: membrane integrity-associated transporter subunit PqiC [Labilithrix sp.]|nr:membrane integrity-associated transporter subunit PqiC [Labilithrix sp.]MBX3223895.1 membrane integrity-associated transporter subunit PqiC [Labilithrix sp.]
MAPRSIVLVAMLSGCALTSKGDALAVRWFDPETPRTRLTSAAEGAPAHGPQRAVELGRVTSGGNLRERIAYRDDAYEVGYYDDKRWTERPEVYVRRALSRAMFEDRGMRRALGGPAPVLEVEVLAFEELRGESRAARIQLRVVLHDDRDALLERTILVDRPVRAGAKGFEGLVEAMAEALDAAGEEVANATARALDR